MVIGHPEIMRRALQLVRSTARVVEVTDVAEVESTAEWMPCLRCGGDDVLDLPAAQVHAGGGRAAYEAVTIACELAQAARSTDW